MRKLKILKCFEIAAVIAASVSTPLIASPPAMAFSFANCDQAEAAGAAPIFAGQPGYSSKLDRDGDGVACELMGQPAPVPLPASPPTVSAASRCPAPSGSSTAAVIGCYCNEGSSDTVTADGTPAYCRHVLEVDMPSGIWMNRPEDIVDPPGPTDLNMYVCESQAGQSITECAAYLTQPSYPGDGVPHY